MSIELRDLVVTLYQGSYDKQIRDALDAVERAKNAEKAGGPKTGLRMASPKPESQRLAELADKLVDEAKESAVKVTLWALDYLEWRAFADAHPPREGNRLDGAWELNMETARDDLLLASLVPADDALGMPLGERLEAGKERLTALGRMSRNNYIKLSQGAWQVNTADDVIPKLSVLSAILDDSEESSEPRPTTG